MTYRIRYPSIKILTILCIANLNDIWTDTDWYCWLCRLPTYFCLFWQAEVIRSYYGLLTCSKTCFWDVIHLAAVIHVHIQQNISSLSLSQGHLSNKDSSPNGVGSSTIIFIIYLTARMLLHGKEKVFERLLDQMHTVQIVPLMLEIISRSIRGAWWKLKDGCRNGTCLIVVHYMNFISSNINFIIFDLHSVHQVLYLLDRFGVSDHAWAISMVIPSLRMPQSHIIKETRQRLNSSIEVERLPSSYFGIYRPLIPCVQEAQVNFSLYFA